MMDGKSDEDCRHLTMPPLVNAHTHCADAGVHPSPGMTLEELVAPPDGLKHRYLRETPRGRIVGDMRRYAEESRRNGISRFVDFREGGAEGCRMLREASSDAFVMGRPVSPVFDPSEMDDILSVADGIALPSVTDMERSYVERCADAARKAGKPFAIHASERIREDMEFILSLEPAFVVHMVAATDRDLRMTADAGVPVVVCPRSNAYFGIAAPVVRMADAGITLALGTDNAMLCSPDLRPEALMVSRMLSDAGRDPSDAVAILRDGSAAIAERLGIATGGPGIRLPLPEGSDGALSALSSDGPAEWL